MALGSSVAVSVSRVRDSRKIAIPGSIEPRDPTPRGHARKRTQRRFEIKADGYRRSELSVILVLMGANSAPRSSTNPSGIRRGAPKPMGSRGAEMADTVGVSASVKADASAAICASGKEMAIENED